MEDLYGNYPPEIMKTVADAHPDYNEWSDIQDRLYDDRLRRKEPCARN